MKKKSKNFFIIIRVYVQWLYVLLCAYQFIYKYRDLKAKVIKTNFLGTQIHKHWIKTKFRLSDLDLKSSDSGTDLDSDLKSSDSGSDQIQV